MDYYFRRVLFIVSLSGRHYICHCYTVEETGALQGGAAHLCSYSRDGMKSVEPVLLAMTLSCPHTTSDKGQSSPSDTP